MKQIYYKCDFFSKKDGLMFKCPESCLWVLMLPRIFVLSRNVNSWLFM
jgi:hypothetical protein